METCISKIWFLRNNNRFLNQDPLENVFGQIRSHGIRQNNPTPTQFKYSYFTVLLNNILQKKVQHTNCELTPDEPLLLTLADYFGKSNSENVNENEEILDDHVAVVNVNQ